MGLLKAKSKGNQQTSPKRKDCAHAEVNGRTAIYLQEKPYCYNQEKSNCCPIALLVPLTSRNTTSYLVLTETLTNWK